jgi:hypothetical protein
MNPGTAQRTPVETALAYYDMLLRFAANLVIDAAATELEAIIMSVVSISLHSNTSSIGSASR